MVLDHVARCTDAVVIAGAPRHTNVLRHRDLHMVHIVRVPDWLVHRVREPQGEQVLHRLLAQIMVDAEHRIGVEDLRDHRVELLGARQVMAERLFDDHTAPCVAFRFGQAAVGELLGHDREVARWHRHVERVVAAGAAVAVQLGHRAAQPFKRVGVLERALHEADALGELLPCGLMEMRAAVFLDVLFDEFAEMVLGPIAAREAGQAEARRQQAAVRQVVDGREQFLTRQVACDTEDDDAAGPAMRGRRRSRGSRRGLCHCGSHGVGVVCSLISAILMRRAAMTYLGLSPSVECRWITGPYAGARGTMRARPVYGVCWVRREGSLRR